MKEMIIDASGLINMQRWFRLNKHRLIRALPFTNINNLECYKLFYV